MHPSRRPSPPEALLREAFREIVGFASGFDPSRGSGRVALVGPPGVGKTVTIARLALNEGLVARKSVSVIAAPDSRAGGLERLKWFCGLLDVRFQQPKDLKEFAALLDQQPADGLNLIDTPGVGKKELQNGSELATLLHSRMDIQKHLVLSTSSTAEQLLASSELYRAFGPSRLIFTRLDEAERLGPALSHAANTATPISYVSAGQDVPGDLARADELDFSLLLGSRAPVETIRAA